MIVDRLRSGVGARSSAGTTPPVPDRMRRPLRDLRISVTDRCNMRCAYCLPPSAPRPVFIDRSQLLGFEQIAVVVGAAAELGVRKIRLTGGEPLLRRDLPRLVAMLASVPGIHEIALTTNGLLLAGQATALAAAGLGRVTVSLDSLDDAVFGRMNGVGASVARVVAGIRAARVAGLKPIKVNAVIRRGVNEAGIPSLARFARDEGLTLRLVEYMDAGRANNWRMADVVSADEMLAMVAAEFPLGTPRSTPGATAVRYPYLDGAGEIGVIGSVSQPFCQACTRARLTADGFLYTCLFASAGHDLRDVISSTDALRQRFENIWRLRDDRYSALRSTAARRGDDRVDMNRIGG